MSLYITVQHPREVKIIPRNANPKFPKHSINPESFGGDPSNQYVPRLLLSFIVLNSMLNPQSYQSCETNWSYRWMNCVTGIWSHSSRSWIFIPSNFKMLSRDQRNLWYEHSRVPMIGSCTRCAPSLLVLYIVHGLCFIRICENYGRKWRVSGWGFNIC